jgi:opacity protein-like surface antigen
MRVRVHLGAGLIAAAVVAMPAVAQGVRYTLAPAAEYTWWDTEVFLEDATLFGLRFGADFGRLIGVNLYYHRRNDLGVRLSESGLMGPGGAALADITSDYSTFGGNVAFKLGTGKVVPFVHAGAGVVQFDPSLGKRIELINYRYGGGLQTDLARNIRGQVFVEDSRLRFDPIDFTDQTRPAGTTATRRSNWTLGVALGFALGGSLDGDAPGADNWSFASIPIEPFVGRLDWDDPLLNRQTVAGVRAGVDVGTLFGLRGFYWQGRSDGLGERQPIQGYGGEAQFNLTSGLGPAPFLVAGAARLDFEEGFEDTDGLTREDETALILGGGIGIRLTDQFKLTASARDYIRAERKFDDAAKLSDITHNWMFSVGLGFNLGRSRSQNTVVAATPPEPRLGEPTTERQPAAERAPATPRVERERHVAKVAPPADEGRVVIIPRLFAGRLTLADVQALEPCFDANIIHPGRYITHWAADPRRLAANLCFSLVVNKINVGDITLDSILEREAPEFQAAIDAHA